MIVIKVLGGLLAAGGFLYMMWGVILLLKEAHKVSTAWLAGCILFPIVMALFVVKFPEKAHVPRWTMLKGILPFALGMGLLVWGHSSSPKLAAQPPAPAPPAAAPVPAPAAAPAPTPSPAPSAATAAKTPAAKAVATPAPVAPALDAKAEAAALAAEARAAAAKVRAARLSNLRANCPNEIGLYCAHAPNLETCLEDYADNLLPGCKAALHER